MNGVHNPLLARLQHEVVNVVADRADWFGSCLLAIANHPRAADLTAPSENDRMASSEDDGFWPPKDDWRADYRPYVVKMGVLYIPVLGVLLNKFPWQLGNWATGYTYIARALQRGLEDEEVKKIAFVCDSPGGEASGNFELVDKIFKARGSKPMRAFANDRAYSAAYAIASAANEITMTRNGGVGSIGVYAMHVDYSAQLEKDGIKVTFIKFGERKTDGNPFEKLSNRARARIQTRIDRLGKTFVETVARNREIEVQVVIDTQADCYGPEEAVEIGLADKIEVFEEALIAFTEGASDHDGEENMTTAKTYTQAELDAFVAAATTEAQTKAQKDAETAATAAAAAATKAAKDRLTAILACEPAKKRPKAALACAQDTDMMVEQATAFLAKLDEEKPVAAAPTGGKPKGAVGELFSAAMEHTRHPEVGGDEDEHTESSDDELAATILRDHHKATGFSAPPQNQQRQQN